MKYEALIESFEVKDTSKIHPLMATTGTTTVKVIILIISDVRCGVEDLKECFINNKVVELSSNDNGN